MSMRDVRSQAGFTIVEAIVAAAICLGVVLGIAGAFSLTLRSSLGNSARLQAAFLEEEGLEAARILRDSGWTSNIASHAAGTPFYLTFDGTTWKATTTNAYIGATFERTIVIDNIYRDGSKNIVQSGGTLDANTKKVTVTVSYRQGSATTSRSLSTYLTNIFNN